MAKLRPLLILIFFSVLIFAVLHFEKRRREESHSKQQEIKNAPEFFLEQSQTTYYTPEGKVDYRLTSDYLEYFKYSETANVTKAYFIFYNPNGFSWHSRSDQATLFTQKNDIQLAGNIHIWQPDRNLEVTTQSLFLSDSRAYAETSDPIQIKSPSGTMESVGMKLALNDERLQLLSNVNGKYHSTKEIPAKKTRKKPLIKKSAQERINAK